MRLEDSACALTRRLTPRLRGGVRRRLFAAREISECGPVLSHLAPRLLAKRLCRQLLRRLSRGWRARPLLPRLKEIEVRRRAGKPPRLVLPRSWQRRLRGFVSLSCDRHYAGAYVVLESRDARR
jgi:hypothetical protein